jgi:hypothetical protein
VGNTILDGKCARKIPIQRRSHRGGNIKSSLKEIRHEDMDWIYLI